MKTNHLLIVIAAALSLEGCATVPKGPPKPPVTRIYVEAHPAQPVGNVIPVMFKIDNAGETWVRADKAVAVTREGPATPPLAVEEAASEAGGAEKLTAAVGNESAASTVGHAFLRDTAEGIGAGFDMGRSAGGAGGAMVMLGAAAGLSVGLVHSVILSVSKNRRELYELDTLQIGEAFGESSIVGPGRSAHGYLFFTKQDYQGVRFLLGGHDSNGGATCETIQAPWGRDWHSEPGATSAVDKPQCFSR